MWDRVTQNIRAAVRGIWKTPGVSAAIVITLALGIGANAMMFGVIDRLLLSPPQHIADADQVRHLYVERTASNGAREPGRLLTYPDFEDLARLPALADRRGLQRRLRRNGRWARARMRGACACSRRRRRCFRRWACIRCAGVSTAPTKTRPARR